MISGRLRALGPRCLVRVCSCVVLALWLGGCSQGSLPRGLLSGKSLSYTGKYFAIERPDVTSEDTFAREEEVETSAFSDRSTRRDTITQELRIKTKGWIYHPALAVYSVDLRPKLTNRTFESAGSGKREADVTFFGYTVDATILQYKPYPLTLSSSRSQSDSSSTLSPDTVTEAAFDRARLYLKYDPVPTTVTVERRTTESKSFIDTQHTTAVVRIESEHRNDRSDSLATAEITREGRDVLDSTSTVDRYELTGRNVYAFSDDLRLSSSLAANKTASADRNSTSLYLSEGLSWKHAKNLSSRYRLRLGRRTSDNSATTTAAGSVGLTHRLYENLTTSVNTNAATSEFSNGSFRSYGAALSLGYRRRIPWGRIVVNNGYRYQIVDSKIDPVLTQVLDESHVLTGIDTAFLESENVDASSIVVTNAAGLVVYIENVDYVIRVSGASIGIERTGVGSGIGDGDTVLVNYNFTPDPPYKTGQATVTFGANLSLWQSLNLSYGISHTEESLLSGIAPSSLASGTVQRARAKLKWKWSTSSVEYEQRDTVRAPLSRFVAREAVSFRPLRRLSVGGFRLL